MIENHLIGNLPEISPVEASKKVVVPVIKDTLAASMADLPSQSLGGRPKLEKPMACNPYKAVEMACQAIEESIEPLFSLTNSENEEIISKSPRKAHQPVHDLAAIGQSQVELETLKKVVTPTEKTENRPNAERMMVTFFRLQNEMEESFSAILSQELQLQQGFQKEIRESTFNLSKDLEEQRKTSQFLGWLNTASTAVVIVGVLAAAVEIYLSREASRVLKFGMGIAGITGGLAMASKAIIENQSNLKQGELFHLNTDIRAIHRIMEQKSEALTEVAEQLFEMAKMLREILDRKLETTKMIFG